jgi:hypothetical protein
MLHLLGTCASEPLSLLLNEGNMRKMGKIYATSVQQMNEPET